MKLKDYIELIENDKIKISKYWIENQEIIQIIEKYLINKEHFINKNSINIIEHHISMIKKSRIILDNPIFINFIKYLNIQRISSSDL